MKAMLVLEDGMHYLGELCGSPGEAYGQLVIYDSHCGFQEVITHPGYHGLIPVFTFPHVGNCGYNNDDVQSEEAQVTGLVVTSLCESPSNWRCLGSFASYLKEQSVTGICNVDTRALARHLHRSGSQYGVISTVNTDVEVLQKRAQSVATMFADRVTEVTSREVVFYPDEHMRLAILDLGTPNSFIQLLRNRHFELYVFPAQTDPLKILECNPFALLAVGGPGRPEDIPYAVESLRALFERVPILGIGLGQLAIGVALGGKSGKMHHGHFGQNVPVLDLRRDRAIMTQQHHDHVLFSCPYNAEMTHINLADHTIEGFRVDDQRIMCVQYMPDNADGPEDSRYVLREFIDMVLEG